VSLLLRNIAICLFGRVTLTFHFTLDGKLFNQWWSPSTSHVLPALRTSLPRIPFRTDRSIKLSSFKCIQSIHNSQRFLSLIRSNEKENVCRKFPRCSVDQMFWYPARPLNLWNNATGWDADVIPPRITVHRIKSKRTEIKVFDLLFITRDASGCPTASDRPVEAAAVAMVSLWHDLVDAVSSSWPLNGCSYRIHNETMQHVCDDLRDKCITFFRFMIILVPIAHSVTHCQGHTGGIYYTTRKLYGKTAIFVAFSSNS
jgi:hypothetical protein